ncbi:MAG: hypothetical protein IKN04_19625 [Clostridia bacterium]|nr:hypothetical protein [Clostridia bacterium]
MPFENRIEFTKENLDSYLKEVAREYRRLAGKGTPAELILIGGASILINYGFRGMTTDIDALIFASSAMEDAILRVEEKFDLPHGWLNADFTRTEAYTPKLKEYSVYYRQYANVLTLRTVSAEYLIAMKLRSGRQYKNDLSDVLGILAEHEKRGAPLTVEQIKKAVSDLYGDWNALPEKSQRFMEDVMNDGHFDALYRQVSAGEQDAHSALLRFEKEYPGVTNEANVDEIIRALQEKTGKKG